MRGFLVLVACILAGAALSGCAVVSVVDTAVSATATVVGTTVDVAAGAVDTVAGSSDGDDEDLDCAGDACKGKKKPE
jgi:hypothetical protein